MNRHFPQEWVEENIGESWDEPSANYTHHEYSHQSRWEHVWTVVFQCEEKRYWQAELRFALTEMQDSNEDGLYATEVFPHYITVPEQVIPSYIKTVFKGEPEQ